MLIKIFIMFINLILYYIRFLFFILTSMIAATIFIPIMLFRPRDPRNALMPAWWCRICARINGIFYEVRGKENIVEKSTGCVVLMNHQSALDLIVLANLWPIMPGSCVIAKREIFWLWPFGLATWLWGTVFINRVKRDQAQEIVNQAGKYIKSKKSRILMFPEGTRHMADELLPFKKGAFHIAVAAQCPIQPVAISKYYFLNSNQKTFGIGHNIIEILPPISTEGLQKSDIPNLIEKTRKIMQEAYTKLSKETLSKYS